jgi:hypothetical protein
MRQVVERSEELHHEHVSAVRTHVNSSKRRLPHLSNGRLDRDK